jgi:hypothetical protein
MAVVDRLASIAVLVMLVAVLFQFWEASTVQFAVLHEAEAAIEEADAVWQQALGTEDVDGLGEALRQYEHLLAAPPLMVGAPNGADESRFAAIAGSVFSWLARPLRLRSLHRVAAGRELLRDEHQLPLIANAHNQLLQENYCKEMLDDATAQLPFGEQLGHQHYTKCVAPIARGTVIFAPSDAESEKAFAQAINLPGAYGVGKALTWTSRWQLPDNHVPGLKAQPWWGDHPAVAALEANFEALAAEFVDVLAWEAEFREVSQRLFVLSVCQRLFVLSVSQRIFKWEARVSYRLPPLSSRLPPPK